MKLIKMCIFFRENGELLISLNGSVEKGRWEYLGNNSLLIDKKDKSYLFKHVFFDKNILALKINGRNEYAFLVNENKFDGELNSFSSVIDFLNREYLDSNIQRTIKAKYEIDSPKTNEKIAINIQKEQEEVQKYYDKNMIIALLLIGVCVIIVFLVNR